MARRQPITVLWEQQRAAGSKKNYDAMLQIHGCVSSKNESEHAVVAATVVIVTL